MSFPTRDISPRDVEGTIYHHWKEGAILSCFPSKGKKEKQSLFLCMKQFSYIYWTKFKIQNKAHTSQSAIHLWSTTEYSLFKWGWCKLYWKITRPAVFHWVTLGNRHWAPTAALSSADGWCTTPINALTLEVPVSPALLLACLIRQTFEGK